jgi:hypothetical protein
MRENMPYWAEVRGLGAGGLCEAITERLEVADVQREG